MTVVVYQGTTVGQQLRLQANASSSVRPETRSESEYLGEIGRSEPLPTRVATPVTWRIRLLTRRRTQGVNVAWKFDDLFTQILAGRSKTSTARE